MASSSARPGITDAVIELVRDKFHSEFIQKAVREALESVCGATGDDSAEYISLSKRQRVELIHGDVMGRHNAFAACSDSVSHASHKSVPRIILEAATGSVRKLFEGNDYLGSFVFIHANIGVCPFHCIVRGRKVLDGSSLCVDGNLLQHMASYPYYDFSFYKVPDRSEECCLKLGADNAIYRGAKFYVAGYPVLDEESSNSLDEEVLVTPGCITRLHSTTGSDFVTGAYECCKGSSGGAVLALDAKLIGLHLHNEFPEDTSYFRLCENNSSLYPEDYSIKAPSTHFKYGRINDPDVRRLESTDALALARYAASNVPHKSSFGCFLHASIIKKKFTSLMMMEADGDEA